MSTDQIVEASVDDPIGDDEQIAQTFRYGITSYGADMPVDGIVKRLGQEAIFIPDFQRKFVWSYTQASRFIESLLLGLPVPGIFLFKEPASRRLMVVDGQQRLLSLQRFYEGTFRGREFRLVGVSQEFLGQTYRALTAESRLDLDDSIIHATIFQQDKPTNDRSSIYSVFERLNTGGSPLQAQEIRASVYRGKLNDLLESLATNQYWRAVYRSENPRKKDEEIILRFLALYHDVASYERPMKQFLNDFMERHQDPPDSLCEKFRRTFETTIEAVAEILRPEALRPERALNVSVADAVLVGLAHRLARGPIGDPQMLREANDRLIDRLRQEALYTTGTTNKDRVEMRIELARDEYESVS